MNSVVKNWNLTWVLCACAVVMFGSCTVDEHANDTGAEVSDVAADGSAAAALAAEDAATIEIISPSNFAQLAYTPGGNLVITVPKVTLPEGKKLGTDYLIKYYLDGEEVSETASSGSYSFTEVPFGQRHLAARLVTANGQQLVNPGSLDGIYVRVNQACVDISDCNDGLICSTETCKVPLGGAPADPKECRYGFDGAAGQGESCCDTELECPYDWLCLENTCKECTANAMCDDGDPCTIDSCDPANNCVHDIAPGCCIKDGDCDDDDWCTTDSCDLASNLCLQEAVDNPLCCNLDSDCQPADPCVLYMCFEDFINSEAYCRFGPAETGCCTDSSECDDNNPCTLNLCEFPDPDDPKGSCIYENDDSLANCCTTNADCDDDNAATKDTCQSNSCIHEENPLYCELPEASMLVINELMISPGDLPDVTAEWIELYNAGSVVVDILGWTIESDGNSHVLVGEKAIGGKASLLLYPGSYAILARSADTAKNGGFTPSYAYGAAISLPDPLEVGSDVSYYVFLKDLNGDVVDKVPVDSTKVTMKDGASLELYHPYADNNDPANWFPAGDHVDPVYNTTYGDGDNYGSPYGKNKSSYTGLPDPNCIVPPGSHPCAEGRCGMDSNCLYPKKSGCCYDDIDCNDFDNCTLEICDPSINLCLESEIDPLCCSSDDECDDQNPCNLDRCIGNKCRFSPNIIANCCVVDDDCYDSDVCTVDTCDTNTKTCNPGIPIVNPPGMGDCCNTNDECEDEDPATLNVCEASTEACIFPADPDYCTDAAAPCDDGNVCTVDKCDVGAQKCLHTIQPGCCQKNTDCPDDDDPCTLEVCDLVSGNCDYPEKLNCCLTDVDCGDGNPCTEDQCAANNVCHNPPIGGCCNVASDCDDDTPCTTDSCVDAQCTYENATECCTIGGTPELLEVECGVDPDGPATCYQWQCTAAAQCNLLTNDTCCEKNKECDDGDACTTDFCHIDNTCQHVSQQGGGCCVTNDDCTADDNNSCTANACVNGQCENVGVPGCIPGVVPAFEPPIDDFSWGDCDAIVGEECAVTDSCWSKDLTGYLGPDEHAECFGWTGALGPDNKIVSPPFNPTGHYLGLVNDYVTVHFTLGFTSNGVGGGIDDGVNNCYLSPDAGDLVINEILADPGAINDANGDGISDVVEDEFVELVNVTDHAILLTNVTITEGAGGSYTFPDGTCVRPGQAMIVYTKYEGSPTYKGALAFSKGSNWGLNNDGDTVTVTWVNPQVGNPTTIDTVTYGGEANNDQSITREKDMDPDSALVQHTATGFGTMSVGRCNNDNRFPHCTPGGNHNLTILITNKENDWSGAEVLDVIPLGGEMENRDHSYELSNFMTAQQETWVGFHVDSDTPKNVDLAIDDFVVGVGHAPFFVDDLKLSKTYDPDTESIYDAPKVKAYLGETEVQVYWAHDYEWQAQDLQFEIISAPSYVSLVESKKMFLYGVFQTKLEFSPTANDHLGVSEVWIRVSDGVFSANLRIPVEVNMSSGYVVYEPPGFLGEVCDPVSAICVIKGSEWADVISATLEGLGLALQRTSDLTDIADWSEIKGVFVTTGAGAKALPLPLDANDILVDFIEDEGGNIYWEGSHIMDFPEPSVQGYFRAMPTQLNVGTIGNLVGTSFLFPLSWTYADPHADVDAIAPAVGSEARLLIRDDSDGKYGLAVANEDGGTGSRTVISSLVLSQVKALGGTAEEVLEAVVEFWNTGYGTCNSADECWDGLKCTVDLCVGGFCTNDIDPNCDGCVDDLACGDAEACTAKGTCAPIPGVLAGSDYEKHQFACDSSDEKITIKATAEGYEVVDDVNVKVSLIMGPGPNAAEGLGGQTLGRTRLTLRHGGKSIILRQPDDNQATHLHITYDVGALPAIGWLNSFEGQMVQGDWELTVEDTDGGAQCNEVYKFGVYVVKGGLKACANSAQCDNGQYCDGTEICNGGTCSGGNAPTFQGVNSDGVGMYVNDCDEVLCDPEAKGGTGEWTITGQAASCAGEICSGGPQNVCGNGISCKDEACAMAVCEADWFCCNAWDDLCSEEAKYEAECVRDPHAWYTDDDQCGYNDSCVGGGNKTEGVCTIVCAGCTTKHSFDLDKAIPDEGCASEFFKITTGDLYATNAYIAIDIDHENAGQLQINLFSPDDKKVVLYDGEGADQGVGCEEIDGMMMSEKTDNLVETNDGSIALGDATSGVANIGGVNDPDMTNYVIPFRLPHLKPGERIREAHLTTYLEGYVDEPKDDGIIPFKLDLYGLGWRMTADVTVGDYFSGPSDVENTLIQKSYFIVQTPNITPNGYVTTSASGNAKLVDYLNAQYAAGAKAGNYVFLRVNADSVNSPPGAHYWMLQTSEGGAQTDLEVNASEGDGMVTDEDKGGGGAEACLAPQLVAGCKDSPQCEDAVCALDPYCCNGQWDGACADCANGLPGWGGLDCSTAEEPCAVGGGGVGLDMAEAYVGENVAPTVANYVMPFPIDQFVGADKEVIDVQFEFLLEVVNDFLADGDMPFKVDLYGLPYRGSDGLLGSDFYQGPLDLDAHLIQDDILTVDSAPGVVVTSEKANSALMDYINTQLDMGADIGDYLFLRFSPDDFDNSNNVGVLDDQWIIQTVEGGTAPKLVLTNQTSQSPKLYWTKGQDCEIANLQLTYETSGPAPTEQMCAFNGVVPDGTWKLQVCDTKAGVTGFIRNASLWVASADDNPAAGQDCVDPIIIDANDGNYVFNGDNTCKADSTAGGCGGLGGHDTVYRFTFGQQKRVLATVTPVDPEGEIADWDTVVYVTASCALGSDACTDKGEVGFTETLDTLLDPGIYYIVVDGPGSADSGRYTLDLTFSTPGANGVACEEDLNCKSGYCSNGFCCDGGDCCDKPVSCPADYSKAPICDDDRECQGHRVDATCLNSSCDSAIVEDDTLCTEATVSKDCGLLAPIYCSGEPNQIEPECPEDCLEDADCDVGTWCNALGQCKALKTDGMSCGGGNQCESTFCVDNVCCNGLCDSLCEHCNLLGKKGLCSFVNSFQDPNDECEGGNLICGGTCDGSGACQYPADTLACDTCTRCDGEGHCDSFNAPQSDPDNSCDICQLCSGQGDFCLAADEGTDPKDDCAKQPVGECGKDGTCNGGGFCRLYLPGTECVSQSCKDGYRDPSHECDGVGNCTNYDDQFCDGHSCEEGIECNFTCGSDKDCIDGYFCSFAVNSVEGVPGSCEPKVATGGACDIPGVPNSGSNSCVSNFCVNQTCCGSACTGGCRYCDDPFNLGTAGQCKDWAVNTDPAAFCEGYYCDGGGFCEVSCEVHSDCKDTHWCDGTECVDKFDNGDECSVGVQCTSGNCNEQDGVCCDTSCDSSCVACREDKTGVESGTCTIVLDGFDPDEECEGGGFCGGACVQGQCNFPGGTKSCGQCKVCNGEGYCIAANADQDTHDECITCKQCNGGGGCKNVVPGIDPDSDCVEDDPISCGYTGFCDGNAACDYYGLETEKVGESCGVIEGGGGDQCDGFEFNGACWYTAPNLGMTCDEVCADKGGFDTEGSKHEGNQVGKHFWPNKADGGNWVSIECSSTDNNTNWGANGQEPDPNFKHNACYVNCACLGGGGGGGADADVYIFPEYCDGDGGSVEPEQKDCAPYRCKVDSCYESCVAHSQCSAGYYCDFGDADNDGDVNECLPKRNDGVKCSSEASDWECQGGFCNNGYCCGQDKPCCVDNNSCEPYTEPSKCTVKAPGGCEGYRTDATCVNNVCQVKVVFDSSNCEGKVCADGSCEGPSSLLYIPGSTCNDSSQCVVDGGGGGPPPGNISSATCDDLLTTDDMWGKPAKGVDLRDWTGSELHYIGCNGDGCSAAQFYCNYNEVTETLEFGAAGTVRSMVDPGNLHGDQMATNYSGCCKEGQTLGLCNAPDGNNNGIDVNNAEALCKALGYKSGEIVSWVQSNGCPESHAVDASGTKWDSDWVYSQGYGNKWKCTDFSGDLVEEDEPVNCNDGNPCTKDSCNTVTGCKNPADNSYEEDCYDGPAATANVGQCSSGVRKCSAGTFTVCIGQALPGLEVCGGGDENCNGSTDEELAFGCSWYRMDADGDESGLAKDKKCLCVQGQVPGYTAFDAGYSDCDDNDPDIYPDAIEICDGKDNNCKAGIDEKGAEGCTDYFYDADKDGYGISGLSKCVCEPYGPYTATNYGDCNDINPNINPGAAELCDGYDNNCDAGVDEGADVFCLAGLGSHAVSAVCGGIGGCKITACDLTYYDADLKSANGCEAREDDFDINGQAETCGTAWDFGTLPDNGSQAHDPYVGGDLRGNMLPGGDEDWYKVYVTDSYPYGQNFHFDVRFTANPGNKYVFDVYKGTCVQQSAVCQNTKFYDNYADFNFTHGGCSKGTPCGQQNCAGESGNDNGGAGGSCGGGHHCGGCGHPGQNCCNQYMNVGQGIDHYWVRVKAPGAVGGYYRLKISNNQY